MAGTPSLFRQSVVTKILKACKDSGFPAPVIIIEPQKITVKPGDTSPGIAATGWEDCE
jgi:hypothetical protein